MFGSRAFFFFPILHPVLSGAVAKDARRETVEHFSSAALKKTLHGVPDRLIRNRLLTLWLCNCNFGGKGGGGGVGGLFFVFGLFLLDAGMHREALLDNFTISLQCLQLQLPGFLSTLFKEFSSVHSPSRSQDKERQDLFVRVVRWKVRDPFKKNKGLKAKKRAYLKKDR